MFGIRNRSLSRSPSDEFIGAANKDCEEKKIKTKHRKKLLKFIYKINIVIGIVLMLVLSYIYAWYIEITHENSLWFTAIKEVEREISLRTETGLYYSYFKQVVSAPSLTKGIIDLIYDNITEHGRTINILHRFNIYQELFLATIYRLIHKQIAYLPIFFYLKAIWNLHGVYVGALYLNTWLLSDSWLAGVVVFAFYMSHKFNMTRVISGPPLRECFSLPFLFLQLACITYYLNSCSYKVQKSILWPIQIFTFLYCITWQFAPFIMLMQAVSLFFLALLNIIPMEKINKLFICNMISLIGVGVLQFFNSMVFNSPVFSFIIAACIILNCRDDPKSYQSSSFITHLLRFLRHTALTFALAFLISLSIKQMITEKSDSHIYKYILLKFGLGNPRDFESRIYFCSPAFQMMEFSTIVQLSENFLFPLYCGLVLLCLSSVINYTLNQWRLPRTTVENLSFLSKSLQCNEDNKVVHFKPEIIFLVVLSLLFGLMALTTIRMIVLWTPLMSVLASVMVSNKHIWSFVLAKICITNKMVILLVRHTFTLLLLCRIVYISLPAGLQEFKELGEFWDPNTVALMDWINLKTKKTAAFSGSMQLLAGVKLCTGRPITNHPHFEDYWLRKRTLEVYQIYGCKHPKDVHLILKRIGTKYIILEDSICRIPPKIPKNCRLRDLIDFSNNHIPEFSEAEPGLTRPSAPSFCEAVRYTDKNYSQYFKLVFENKTFRVYKVL